MSFKPLTNMRNLPTQSLPVTTDSVLTRFSHCKVTSGYLVDGADDAEAEFIALETVTGAASNASKCLVWKITGDVDVEALFSTTPVQATHVGNDYDFANGETINTDTTNKVFHIDSIVNATDKLVLGRFNKPALA